MFKKEADFEKALVQMLSTKGWEAETLDYPDEAALSRTGRRIWIRPTRISTAWTCR